MASGFRNLTSPDAPPTPRRPPAAGGHQVRSAPIKAPEGLEAVETKNESVKVRWNHLDQLPASYQLLGYDLEHRIMDVRDPKPWVSVILEPAITDLTPYQHYTVVHLTPYKHHQICVSSIAQHREGEPVISERSAPIHVVTREQNQPYKPGMVQLDDTHGSLVLTWKEPQPAADVSPGSYEYVVEMCLYVEDKTLREWAECCKTTLCKFPIKEHRKWKVNVECSGHYRFRVSANNTEPENTVSSLPQEMGNPEVRIRIEAPWSMKQLFDAAVEALWPFSGTYARREHGSIIFVISCHDVISLRDLWMNYRLGIVKKFFQNLFTRRIRPASVVTDAELKINIEEQDFYSCCRHLLLTQPTDQGFRVARLGDAQPRSTRLGLSEDYPVYCKPTSHRTTCPRLDFLDPAVSTARLKDTPQPSSSQKKRDAGGVELPVKTKALPMEGLQTGELDPDMENFILDNYVILSEMLDARAVIPYLIQDRVLTTAEEQRILSRAVTKEDKARELLDAPLRRGNCTTKQFMNILRMTNQTGLIDGLKNKYQDTPQPSSSQKKRDADGAELPVKTKALPMEGLQTGGGKRTAKTRHLGQPSSPPMKPARQVDVSKYFDKVVDGVSSDWDNLARKLNFSETQIDRIRRKKEDEERRCREMLRKWKNRKGKAASLQALKKALIKIEQRDVAERLEDSSDSSESSDD